MAIPDKAERERRAAKIRAVVDTFRRFPACRHRHNAHPMGVTIGPIERERKRDLENS